MPPRKKAVTPPICVRASRGVGPATGLECWLLGDRFVLLDATTTGTFSGDVSLWNTSLGLKAETLKYLKDAHTQQNAA
jgi:hypothetical protein